MFPVYGLAEASLAVAFPPLGSAFKYITVDRRSLGIGSVAQKVAADDPNALQLMCEGQAIPFTSVKLVDDAGVETAPDQVGHLLIKGDNVTRGYFRNPEANAASISADGWLSTGDLALWHDGELYVTGRSKEIIFVNGQNYYPHDIEAVVQHEPGSNSARWRRPACATPTPRPTNSCCSCSTAATWPRSCRSRPGRCTS